MTKRFYLLLGMLAGLILPQAIHAQTTTTPVEALDNVLQNVYDQLIPMCSQLINVCRAIAGFGTIFYIGYRVWKNIARAEPIDIFPLFRPLVISALLGIYPLVLASINGILKPSVTATSAIVTGYNTSVHTLLAAEANSIIVVNGMPVLIAPSSNTSPSSWDKYSQPTSTQSSSGSGFWSSIGDGFKFVASGFLSAYRLLIKFMLSTVLEVLFYAASLCIDTIRTFHLIILAILGPFAFAFSCYDGLHNSLTHWLARYINIYLWLPVSNLLGAILADIQLNMLQLDLAQAQSGSLTLFSPTDFAYLIFLVIGIVGYFTVPGIANYIVHTHGGNPLAQKVSQLAGMAVKATVGAATGGVGGAAMASAGSGGGGGAAGGGFQSAAQAGNASQFNRDKIAG